MPILILALTFISLSWGQSQSELFLNEEEVAFVKMLNEYRQDQIPALVPLKVSKKLTRAAKWLVEDMAANNHCDHIDSLGRDARPRFIDFGYTYRGMWGENVGCGFYRADLIFEGWRNSPGHYRNYIKPTIRVIGIAYYRGHWAMAVGQHQDELIPLESSP